jgi:hypothetical protein
MKTTKREIENRNMETAGALIGITLVLCEHKGNIPNWKFVVEKLRDVALGISRCKEEVKVPRNEKRSRNKGNDSEK